MRALVVSTSYPSDASDWRGVFIRNIVSALARVRDLDISFWGPPGALPDGVHAATTPAEAAWLGRLMQHGGISHLMRQHRMSAILAPLTLLRMLRKLYCRQETDLYHINWLQSALPLRSNAKPVLIAVLGNDLKLMRLPLVRTLLRRMMRERRVAICPNAEWMQAPLVAAFGDRALVIPVSFGIDAVWYSIARQPDRHRPLWLAVTRLTADKLGPLFEWSEKLFRDQQRELHLFGPMQEVIDVPAWVKYHGAASPAQLATEWFPRATGLITLSCHAEGRPQVMLEAMAASLPIVASRMPAHASLVQDRVTGALCDSADDYAAAVAAMEDATTNARVGEAARDACRNAFGTWDDCARRYVAVYRQLLGTATHE